MHVLPVKECSREWQAFWRFKKANPQGSCRGQKHHAHFRAWVKPLIERLPPSKHPLSPASDVTGHFHTPTLFNTLLLILHWSCVGRNPHTSAGSSVSYSYGCLMATHPKILWKKIIFFDCSCWNCWTAAAVSYQRPHEKLLSDSLEDNQPFHHWSDC